MHLFKHLFPLILTFSSIYFLHAEIDVYSHELSEYQITEIHLKNGLRVCLKKSDLESKEFDFQLFAIGGIAHLPLVDQPSAWLAAG